MEIFKFPKAEQTISCWTDLLGFESQMKTFQWDLSLDKQDKMAKRLTSMMSLIVETASNFEFGTFINDAIIRTLKPEYYSGRTSFSAASTWIEHCLESHCKISQLEKSFDDPGVRTIICEGQMLSCNSIVDSIWREPFNQKGAIVSQFNTGLTKCYLADSRGSKIGLKKGSIYIEDSILTNLTSRFKCRSKENMFFFFPHALLEPVSKYYSISEGYTISKYPNNFDEDDGYLRAPWLRLGDKITIEERGLIFTLVEIIAYSPRSDLSLFWYDTFTGMGHGISMYNFINDPFVDKKVLKENSEEYSLLREFIELPN
ncbi:MAG: hypothetical protein V4557_12375 [Bacteroidota bacterium]